MNKKRECNQKICLLHFIAAILTLIIFAGCEDSSDKPNGGLKNSQSDGKQPTAQSAAQFYDSTSFGYTFINQASSDVTISPKSGQKWSKFVLKPNSTTTKYFDERIQANFVGIQLPVQCYKQDTYTFVFYTIYY